ncbi:MAG TPA: alpha/beta fold hydrolase, partial [Fervidobacterium sp.]|nr:alpha/beta fold hydrolase [Fervidobacterium sp.]
MIYSLKRGEPKKGWVLIVHGLGEHIGRYDKLIDMLVKEGFCVIGFDLPGHGKSSGKRGNTTIEDIVEIIDELTKSVNRFTVFGHSLGGLIAIRYTELRPQKVNNLVVSSPALNIEMKSSQKAMMSIFSVLAPSLTVNNGINPNLLSRNKSAIEKYVSDSLVHDRISVRLAKSMMKNIELA